MTQFTQPLYADQTAKESDIARENIFAVSHFLLDQHAKIGPEELALWKLYLAHMEGVHNALARLQALWLTGSSELPQWSMEQVTAHFSAQAQKAIDANANLH